MPKSHPLSLSNFQALIESPVFLSTLSSWFFAQLLKAIILLCRRGSASLKDVALSLLWKTGGMPSSHSALVTALAVSIGFAEGFSSNLFIVTLAFTLVVIRDSMGVRRSSGLQARVLNLLGRSLAEKAEVSFKPVKEVQGHTPLEVIVGALFGLFIAVAFSIL